MFFLFFPLEQNQCHLKMEVELDQLYTPHLNWVIRSRAQIRLYKLAVLPVDGGESSPQFEKATIEDLNSPMFTLEFESGSILCLLLLATILTGNVVSGKPGTKVVFCFFVFGIKTLALAGKLCKIRILHQLQNVFPCLMRLLDY